MRSRLQNILRSIGLILLAGWMAWICAPGAALAQDGAPAGTASTSTDPDTVEQSLKDAIQAKPADQGAKAAYIRFLSRQERADEARLLLKTLDTKSSAGTEVLRAEMSYYKGDTDEARRLVRTVSSDHLEEWTAGQDLLIRIDYLEGRIKECEADCRELLARDALSQTGRTFLGRCLTRLGKYAEAQKTLEAARAGQPGDVEVNECLAELKDAQGRAEESAKLRRAIDEQVAAGAPGDIDGLAGAAAALRMLNKPQEALQNLELALRQSPADPYLTLEKIRLFRKTWGLDVADKNVGALLKIYPKCAMGWAEQGEILWQLKQNSDVVAGACERALLIDPTILFARSRLISYALIAGDYAKAERLIAENRKYSPTDSGTAQLQTALGLLKKGLRDVKTACPLTSGPVALEAERPLAVQMGELLLAQSNYQQSREWFGRAMKSNPEDNRAIRGAGVAAFRCDDYEQAARLLEQSFNHNGFDIETKNLLDYLDSLKDAKLLDGRQANVGYQPENSPLAHYTQYMAGEYLDREAQTYKLNLDGQAPVRIQLCANYGDLGAVTQGVPSYG